ncbi:MAG: hypothetical protein U5J97_00895 [Trueperaceae bacterium]|nr:hypothetical protein [Trueperaceae bacterium]
MKIAVIGCGWLGLPLAASLAAAGHEVSGTTTRPGRLAEIRKRGVRPKRLLLAPDADGVVRIIGETGISDGVDRVVVAVSPSGDYEAYPKAIAALAGEAARREAAHLTLCSSTGVYPGSPAHPLVREEDASPSASARAGHLLAAEKAVRDGPVDATIVRLAGLWGYGRHPARSLAGRTLDGPGLPVNLLHRDDAIAAITALILPTPTTGTFSVAAEEHPPRGPFYTSEARRLGLAAPTFSGAARPGKRVSAQKLADATGFRARWMPGDADAP